MPLDPAARAFLDRLAAEPAREDQTPDELRARFEASAAELFGPTDPVGAVVDRTIPGPVRMRIYEPVEGERPYPALIFIHGGGFVFGSLDMYDGVCRALCARTPCMIVSLDYRLAPEHRFPAAVEDTWAGTVWVAEHASSLGVDASRLAVGGDSAGGTLSAVVALRARDHGLRLAQQLLIYPGTDAANLDRPSHRENAKGYALTVAAMHWHFAQYLGPDGDATHPDISPLRAPDVSGVAPAFVLTLEYDPLRDEGEAYAERLREAGVPTTAIRLDGLFHGVMRMPGIIPRGNEVLDLSAQALREALVGVAQSTSS